MGRRTLQPAIDSGIGDPYAHLDTYVVSSTLAPSDCPDVTTVDGDPVALHKAARASRRRRLALRRHRLAITLAPLIDRLVLKVNPAVAGGGTALFDGDTAITTIDSPVPRP